MTGRSAAYSMPEAPARAAAGALLSCRAISKRFGATVALHEAWLDLGAGEIVAVMGPSGSGKSTLLHCAAGIVAPDAGEVVYEGRSIGALPDADRSRLRRGDFGFVFQFGRLVPELSCQENVALPLRLVTLLTLPTLRRMMRPEALRVE